MNTGKILPIEYVDEQHKLEGCKLHLNECTEFSFDLEFDDNHYSYGITLCLIQISTSERCFVIDTLKPLDLSGLFRVFENKAIRKICFSPDQDLKLLHSLKCKSRNIFDVAVAAKLLNTPASGLGSVLESKLQILLDKKLQKSNWSKRPLSKEQIEYSANDVMHLITLRDMFLQEADQKGILHWLNEENELLDTFNPEQKATDDFVNRKDREALSQHTLFALNELLKYAHALGKKINKPAGWLISKQILIDLIRDRLSFQEMTGLRGIHPSFKEAAFKQHFENVMREADSQGLSKKSPNPKPSFEQRQETFRQKALAEEVKAKTFYPIKKAISERYGEYAADFIFGDQHMNQLASGKIRIPELKMKYRTELICSIAGELEIDLSGYM